MQEPHKLITDSQQQELLNILKSRFKKNMHRHKDIDWERVEVKLRSDSGKLWSLFQMEATGGEPDVIGFDVDSNVFIFCDCSTESPKGRRSLCYDRQALDDRKEFKPENSVLDMAAELGIELLDETAYRKLQSLETIDTKTSSWIRTPDDIRRLGGAIFAEFRYGKVFIFHNGASSYYAARGFRGMLRV